MIKKTPHPFAPPPIHRGRGWGGGSSPTPRQGVTQGGDFKQMKIIIIIFQDCVKTSLF